MTGNKSILLIAAVAVCAAGCTPEESFTGSRPSALNNSQTIATAGPVSRAASEAQPPNEYKQERDRLSLLGLDFSTGRVRTNADAAARFVPELTQQFAASEYQRGIAELNQNHKSEAIGAFRSAVIADSDNPVYYEALGNALIFKGKMNEALASFRTALDIDPSSLAARTGAARVLESGTDTEAAINAWNSVLEISPDNPRAHARLASLYYFAGQNQSALEHLNTAEELGYPVPGQLKVLILKASDPAG